MRAMAWSAHSCAPDAAPAHALLVCTADALHIVCVQHDAAWTGPAAAGHAAPPELRGIACSAPLPESVAGQAPITMAQVQLARAGSILAVLCAAHGSRAPVCVLQADGLQAGCDPRLQTHAASAQSLDQVQCVGSAQGTPSIVVAAAAEQDRLRLTFFTEAGGSLQQISTTALAANSLPAGAHASCVQASLSTRCAAAVLSGAAGHGAVAIWHIADTGNAVHAELQHVAPLPSGPWQLQLLPLACQQCGVAVAAARKVLLFAGHRGEWVPLAAVAVPGTPHSLSVTADRQLAVALQTQMICLAPATTSAGATPPMPLDAHAAACAAPRPLWHPANICMLLARGTHGLAAHILRRLLAALRNAGSADVSAEVADAIGAAQPDLLALCAAMRSIAADVHAAAPSAAKGPPISAPPDATQTGALNMSAFSARAPSPAKPSRQQGGGGAVASGLLDLSSFASLHQSAAQAQSTGQLDMSSFGQQQQQGGQTAAMSAFDTGQLDMASFGMGGAAAARTPAAASRPVPEPAARPQLTQHDGSTAVATGMLDTSAFGAPGAGRRAPRSAAHKPAGQTAARVSTDSAASHVAQSQQSAAMSGTDSGLLDMSHFGAGRPSIGQASATSRQSLLHAIDAADRTLQSGQVDTSVLGNTADLPGASQPAVPADAVRTSQQGAAGPKSGTQAGQGGAMETGQVDLSAFSGWRNPQQGAHGSPRAQHPPPAGPTAEARQTVGAAPLRHDDGSCSSLASQCSSIPVGPRRCAQDTRFDNDGAARPVAEAVRGSASGAQADDSGALDLGRAQSAVQSVVACASGSTHCCGVDAALSAPDIQALQAALGAAQAGSRDSNAAAQVTAQLRQVGLSAADACVLMQLAQAFCACVGEHHAPGCTDLSALGTALSSLDTPSKRFVSLARLGSAVLQAGWAAAAAAAATQAGANAADDRAHGAGRRAHAMSTGASALLQQLRHGSTSASGALSRGASHALSDSATASFFGADSAALSMHSAAAPANATGTAAHWAQLGLAPCLSPGCLLWACSAGAPAALLEVAMTQMPQQEPADDAAAGGAGATSSAFSKAMRGSASTPPNAWTWRNFRRAGAGFWLREPADITCAIDRIAKATFAAEKRPLDVALWYCAQGRCNILGGLLRTTGDAKVAAFFARDFSHAEARAAAAKNAHKLLSQHRYSLAAAFFLCARDVAAALDTCLNQMHDLQLAIVVCKLLDASAAAPSSVEWPRGGAAAKLLQVLQADAALEPHPVLQRLVQFACQPTAPLQLDARLLQGLLQQHLQPAEAALPPLGVRAVLVSRGAADWVLHAALQAAQPASGQAAQRVAVGVDGRELVRSVAAMSARAHACAAEHAVPVAALQSAALCAACAQANSGANAHASQQRRHRHAQREWHSAIVHASAQAHLLGHAQSCLSQEGASAEHTRNALHRACQRCTACQRCELATSIVSAAAGGSEDLQHLQHCGVLPDESDLQTVHAAIVKAVAPSATPASAVCHTPVSHRSGTPASVQFDGKARAVAGSAAARSASGDDILDQGATYALMNVGEKDAQVWPFAFAIACDTVPAIHSAAACALLLLCASTVMRSAPVGAVVHFARFFFFELPGRSSVMCLP